ncbi:MAG: hypothetical protein ACRECO_11840 [Xanthobacteraceae bacterium]
MTAHVQLQFTKDHRLFDSVRRLCIYLQATAIAKKVILGHNFNFEPGANIIVQARHPPTAAKFPVHGPLEQLVHFPLSEIGPIPIHIIDQPQLEGGVQVHGLEALNFNVFEVEFSLFYANYCEWIKKLVADRRGNHHNWPETWNFARIVRNAINHGGTINIDSRIGPTVSWRGIQFSHLNKGEVIREHIACGDLFALMVDMDAELTVLSGPLQPYLP